MGAYHVIITLFLLWKDTTCQEAAGYSLQVNRAVTVQEGLCVTIPCSFTADNRRTFTSSTGYWWKYGSNDIVASNDKSATVVKPNFQLTGNPDIGDCTLTITGARKEDRGTYSFRFEESPRSAVKYSYISPMVSVAVTELSQKPEIYVPGKITAGQEVTLTCSLPGTCSGLSPAFQWTMGDQKMHKDSSTMTFTPSRSDNMKIITCTVTLPNLVTATQTYINMVVQYPPTFTITGEIGGKILQKTETVTVLEGDSLRLNCSVDSNPAANVTWKKGEDDVPSSETGQGLELSLTDIQTNAADTYYCVAESEHGKFQCPFITDPPRKPDVTVSSATGGQLEANQSVITNEDGGLSINCSVDSNPAAVLSWNKGEDKDSNNIIGEGFTWSLVKITSSESGIYRCSARNTHGSNETRIQINRKPEQNKESVVIE
ncbi:sialic acid-binding Ig-like lectin 13 [Pseudophryne corroboree]|uniref:sialic acid-binding Ig-like lectin 13 n=1 Tax=Pseudophryne corroboree TaxID=495146 RepID=UPI0030817C42